MSFTSPAHESEFDGRAGALNPAGRSMPICSICSSRAVSKQQLAHRFPLSRGKYSNHPASRNIGWWAPAPDACLCRRPEAKESPVDRKISIGQWNASSWITLNSAQVKHAYLVSAYCADAVVSIHTVCASWSKRSDDDLLLLACIYPFHDATWFFPKNTTRAMRKRRRVVLC